MIKAIITLLLSVLVFTVPHTPQRQEYEMECYVIEVSDDIVSCVSEDGDIWQFKDDDALYISGDKCLVIMNDNATSEYKLDDVIVKVEKIS